MPGNMLCETGAEGIDRVLSQVVDLVANEPLATATTAPRDKPFLPNQ